MLSWISADFFARSPVLVFPLIALVIFSGVFLGEIWRVLRTHDKHFEQLARMPLEREGHD